MIFLFPNCTNAQTKKTNNEMKVLVTYFSATGTTKAVAEKLSKIINADIYEIKPEIPYTSADLDWHDKESRSTIEMQDKNSRPAIADKNAKIENYDVIYVGFPIWWYVAPTIINTFLESYDFSGKTVILFATSGGSSFGKTVENLKGSCSPKTIIKESKVFFGPSTEKEIEAWVKSMKD
ncbi:NAD(P)H-dependent oxidoreductase [Odoribacter sp. OttesenSCG-928-L07]|nr:NAD(P)H-dependent oxidoreductase [Odoribacter sp. OttesenSCG-928-L07]